MFLGFFRSLWTFLSIKNTISCPMSTDSLNLFVKVIWKYSLLEKSLNLEDFGACLLPDKSEFFQISHYEQSWKTELKVE